MMPGLLRWRRLDAPRYGPAHACPAACQSKRIGGMIGFCDVNLSVYAADRAVEPSRSTSNRWQPGHFGQVDANAPSATRAPPPGDQEL